jgi:aryl-alcohol dehydrogenase-like predicted oxidoreductase
MKYVTIEGIDKPCSQLIMGSMIFAPDKLDLAVELLDAFVAFGGNTIDTAHIYNGGKSELAIGQWLKLRNNRDDIVILDKGAHPNAAGPRVTPEAIASDLRDSLERLQVDYIDIYMLHRDDPNVPVSTIIGTLNEHKAAGKIGALGTSNWTVQRIQEANEYAAANGLAGFTCNSPNLSLAKPNEPRWAGCISADHEYNAWHEKHQMPLMSWSSQAGGFFTGRFSPEYTEDKEMVRVYYNAENWERLRRTQQLAEEKGGVNANHIALSYVLNQSFPTCAIIGPQKLSELEDSVKAVHVEIIPEEIRWLDLQD